MYLIMFKYTAHLFVNSSKFSVVVMTSDSRDMQKQGRAAKSPLKNTDIFATFYVTSRLYEREELDYASQLPNKKDGGCLSYLLGVKKGFLVPLRVFSL